MLYRDRWVSCTPRALVIRGYYFPLGLPKTVPYEAIRTVKQVSLGWLSGRGRIWGTGLPWYWLHLDLRRPARREALVLDVGRKIRPVITPDDVPAVRAIIEARRGAGGLQS
jgi:hypothetical protein